MALYRGSFRGPTAPYGDFPRQPRPPGGFTRPMLTCADCGAERPRFHWELLGSCPVCQCPEWCPDFVAKRAAG